MIFHCDKCGLCCQHLELVPELSKFDSGNGRCIYLAEDNLCSIYEERPYICNVSKMYELEYCNKIDEEEYLRINNEGCRLLKEMYG